MATWKVEPTWKKSIVEQNYWTKDGKTIINEIGWRWGEFTLETEGDEPPELDEDTDYLCDDQFELVDFSTSDGCWEENEFEGDWEDDELEEMEQRLSDGEISVYELEDEGWVCESAELYIQCEVEITKVEDGAEEKAETNESSAEWPFEYAQFKCTKCDYTTEDIMDLVDNPNDDDNGAYLCPKCNGKVEM